MTHSSRPRSLRKLPLAIAIGLTALASQQAFSHGYIESPKSRAYMCSATGGNLNKNCGSVTWEPQSVEYAAGVEHHYKGAYCGDDFSKCGPADGTIAAGGIARFSGLNEQTATRWQKNDIKPGLNTFTWRYTAGHPVRYKQFYITKKDWNPNLPLTRDSFELKPLLHKDGNNVNPGSGNRVAYDIDIPSDRSGYHVILATWRVGDTSATFYQAVDLNIDSDGVPPSEWNVVGAVQPEQLTVGDKVTARVFTSAGEQTNRQVVLNIDTAEQAQANTWPFLLAQKVNQANAGYQMGQLNADDQVVPSYGTNNIYTKAGSDVVRVEIQKEQPSVPGQLSITGLQDSYTLKDGAADLHFNAIAQGGKYTVDATVFNGKGESVAYKQGNPGENTPHFQIPLRNMSEGNYDLVVVAKPEKGDLLQQTHRFALEVEGDNGGGDGGDGGDGGKGDYDFVFPDGLKSYKAGTKVLAKDGNTYECKPFPYSGYCIQWSPTATQFEPGTGSNWKDAWIRK